MARTAIVTLDRTVEVGGLVFDYRLLCEVEPETRGRINADPNDCSQPEAAHVTPIKATIDAEAVCEALVAAAEDDDTIREEALAALDERAP